jgi:hypothetical protein
MVIVLQAVQLEIDVLTVPARINSAIQDALQRDVLREGRQKTHNVMRR